MSKGDIRTQPPNPSSRRAEKICFSESCFIISLAASPRAPVLDMKKTKFVATLFCLFLLPASLFGQTRCAPAKHARLPLVLNLTYHKARPKLLARGWQPYQTIHHNSADTDPSTSSGNGQIYWRKGYWEIESCAGTGLAPCSFLFEDAYRNRLRVTTAGEEYPKQKYFARVTGYKFVCDEDE